MRALSDYVINSGRILRLTALGRTADGGDHWQEDRLRKAAEIESVACTQPFTGRIAQP